MKAGVSASIHRRDKAPVRLATSSGSSEDKVDEVRRTQSAELYGGSSDWLVVVPSKVLFLVPVHNTRRGRI